MTLFIFGVTVLIMVVVYLLFDVSGEKKVIEDIRLLKISVERHGNVLAKNFSDYVTRNEHEKQRADFLEKNQENLLLLSNARQMVDAYGVEVTHLQEHQALLRKDLMELHEKISNKRPLIKMQGPLQVEFYTPSKNLGGEGKKPAAPRSRREPKVKSQPLFKNM